MSLSEFIKLEAQALDILQHKDPSIAWKAIECGAAEKVRLYAESRDYMVTLNELLGVFFVELCLNMASSSTIQYLE